MQKREKVSGVLNKIVPGKRPSWHIQLYKDSLFATERFYIEVTG